MRLPPLEATGAIERLWPVAKGIGAGFSRQPSGSCASRDIIKARKHRPEGHLSRPSSVLAHTEERSLGSRLAVQ